MDWEFLSPEERLIAEQAILNYRELSNICREAEDGHVLNVCETLALDQGRELTRKTIELILNDQAPTVEKKGLGRVPVEHKNAIAEKKPAES